MAFAPSRTSDYSKTQSGSSTTQDPGSSSTNYFDGPDGADDPIVGPGSGQEQLSDDRIVTAVRRAYIHEWNARLPHETWWDRVWKRVNNRYDWRTSAHWQSKKNFPAILVNHLKVCWERQKSLEMAGDKWLECETDEPDWQPLLDVPRDLLLNAMRSGNDPANNFLNVFAEMTGYSSITGNGYIRIVAEQDGYVDMTPGQAMGTVEDDESVLGDNVDDPFASSLPDFGFGSGRIGADASGYKLDDADEAPPQLPGQKGFRLQFQALNSRHVLKDTAGRRTPRYLMHQQTMTKGEYRREAEARGWEHTEDVLKCGFSEGNNDAGSAVMGTRAKAAMEKDLARDPKYRDTVELLHFYGTLYDELGRELCRNSYLCIAQRRFLVCPPVPLPYWHGQIPIVCGGEICLPGAPYFKSLTEVNIEPQEARVQTLNMLFDYLNQAINPPTEMDVDQLADWPNQLSGGVYPGKLLRVRKAGNNGPAVARSGIPDMSSGVIQVIGLIKPELAEFTGMSDTPAMPRTRNRISAEEFKQRAAASGGIIEGSAKNIERSILEPLAWQGYLVTLQKIPQDEWEAFIDRKIAALENRTRATPPGSSPNVPAGTQPAVAQPNAPAQMRPGMPPNSGQQPSPRGKLPTNTAGSVAPGGGGPTNPANLPPDPNAPPYEDPDFVGKLQEMRGWGPRERFVKLGAKFRFRVKIYTALESRREMLEQLSQLIQGAEAMPALASRIKWHTVAEEYCMALQLDPERYLWPNAGSTPDMQVAASQQSLAARPVGLVPPQQPSAPPPSGY